ncbi:MAG: hypothetical protein FWG90_00215 [Oscillospiraceae bacterium]|nr:hypothetical protein [Oscillospiraceae bacterium]
MKAFRNFEGISITTHNRLLSTDLGKYGFVIVDEDIVLSSIISNKIDITISDLKKLKKELAPEGALSWCPPPLIKLYANTVSGRIILLFTGVRNLGTRLL